MNDPLYSERAGRPRAMAWPDLAELLWRYWLRVRESGLLAGSAYGYYDDDGEFYPARFPDVEAALTTQLKVGNLSQSVFFTEHQGYELHHGRDLLLDLLEVLHRDWVALPASVDYPTPPQNVFGRNYEPDPEFAGPLDKAAGQKILRDAVNPALRLASPPLELREDGRVHERPPDELAGLVDAPIPPGEEPQVRASIEDAIDHYSRRGATVADRLAAVRSLAGVLERLRPEIKLEALSEDERALFTIANNFGIRHDNRDQRVDYNREAWLDWVFYVYLATARVMIRLRAEQRGDWSEGSEALLDDDIPF